METKRLKPEKWSSTPEMERGATLLLQAMILASQVARDPWDFAVEIATLQAVGMSNSDLRWMICKGFVQHAYEETESQAPNRKFRPNGELSFSNRSCFVLTETGKQFAQEVAAEAVHTIKRGDFNGSVNGIEINGKYSAVEIPTPGEGEVLDEPKAKPVGGSGALMPAFGSVLTEEELRAVVLYERIQFAGLDLDATLADCGLDEGEEGTGDG